ncbi:DUF2786 domain-containing protein [Lysinibacillus xylanilyticus]|uniref:DUF2786 domain-containing protein n=1 Tax=Lysinibacillus xylanilyticus TaxID=582475 RepID=UPI0037FCB200
MESVNESIIKKIKGLLAIANDNKNDEESQSAFLLAQKLMLKHKISASTVEASSSEKAPIEDGQVTAYKKLFWWERKLAHIISENFRVKNFVYWKKLDEDRQRKHAIMFFGYDKDVELAKEMYILAYDALNQYAKKYVKIYFLFRDNRNHKETIRVKDSYIRGFLDGLGEKFKEQVSQMQKEYGLMLLVPKEVEEEYEEFSKDFTKGRTWHMPPVEEIEAYHKGFTNAKDIDYTKSTIDD